MASSGTQSPPLEATGEDKPMGVSSIRGGPVEVVSDEGSQRKGMPCVVRCMITPIHYPLEYFRDGGKGTSSISTRQKTREEGQRAHQERDSGRAEGTRHLEGQNLEGKLD